MKLISWNVNGLRACIQKGFMDFFNEQDADIFALQETKLQPHQIELELPGYHQYWHSAERKGYSGTAVFTKQKPLSVRYDFDEAEREHPKEGRVITLEFEQFYFVTAYVPNSKEELARLDYRMQWEDAMARHLTKLNETKPVVYTGDLNVAVEEIDLKNPKTNHFNPGFSDQERQKMRDLLSLGFADTFRTLYPEKVEYSWWSYRFNSRAKNVGWRIDYFIVSQRLMNQVKDSVIYGDILGSDHCPVGIEIEF
ncbi:exodeoxyribonuclease III [Holdemania filiformis]|uniref:exodeoxyribonuclease III n=1 Tax=Holdemania filiformis TaxID=61171 RepID=UPI00242DF708|nr:exodeoxyribonuclease III [Holdemania filiformis]